jgi:GDPmannose 4,6-dehydratase
VANIIAGRQRKLYLGNLEAKRDWGFAPEYVECQWLMLQQDRPDDYVIGTGESHSVKEFAEMAFNYAGVEIEWQGNGLDEKGIVRSLTSSSGLREGDVIVEIDPKYFRPAEVDYLLADASRASNKLNWKPRVTFQELVKIMVDADMELNGVNPPGEGEKILIDKDIQWIKNGQSVRG